MNSLKTEAIILKGFKYGDSSKIITLFSEEIGKFTAIVKGVRSSKSKNGGVFENMNLVNVIFKKYDNRDLQIISNADCLSSYSKLKDNLEKLLIAYKLLELTSRMMFEYDKSKEVFYLLKETMFNLDEADSNFEVIYLLFQIKFAFLQGINPISDDSRNFVSNYFVRDNNGMNFNEVFLNKNYDLVILNLLNMEMKNFNNIKMDKNDILRIQNAYDAHFMNCLGKYGLTKNVQIINELNKNLKT